MPTVPPRPLRGAHRPLPAPRPPTRAALPTSPLKILVAGLDKDARGAVEAVVRRALASRPATEAWTVSLVKLGGRWSITLNGPRERTRSLSLTCDGDSELEPVIRRAIDADATAPLSSRAAPRADTLPAQPPAGLAQQRHSCEHCGGALLVVYEPRAGEALEPAPVACPHCWRMNHVEIGAWAASGRDYRCEKAP